MVHPLVITAAATAGIGAAAAFEVAVFGPWREENWPNGFGQGVRSELHKLRREFEDAVTEIRDDLRILREGRRRGRGYGNDDAHHRLSDAELDDFRRGVGEEASSESAQHEFEMHERQASAYRERLRASMSESLASGTEEPNTRLRRRRTAGKNGTEGGASLQTSRINVPVIDVRRSTSPEAPHHSVGDASPSIVDEASLAVDSRFNSIRSVKALEAPRKDSGGGDAHSGAARSGLLGLDFGQQASSSSDNQTKRTTVSDPFADIVDGTASSWQALFSRSSPEPSSETEADRAVDVLSRSRSLSASLPEATDEGHVILDTNGLSQTLSDQRRSFNDLHAEAHGSDTWHSSGSPYRSNRALHSPSQATTSFGSRSGASESEADFEVISDTAVSEGRWHHLEAPPSPAISSGSEPVAVGGIDTVSVMSEGQESWAELSEPRSDGEDLAQTETGVRSLGS